MIDKLIELVFQEPISSISIISGFIFILLSIAREINVLGQRITIDLINNRVRLIVGMGGLILFLYGITVFPGDSKSTKDEIPYIGVSMVTIKPDIAKKENLSTNKGVWIVGVSPNSPAEKSGLLRNDLIVKLDNIVISNKEQIQTAVKKSQENQILQIIVIRDKNKLNIPVISSCCK